MDVREDISRFIGHVLKQYADSLTNQSTQEFVQRSITTKLNALVKTNKIVSYDLEDIDFSSGKFELSVEVENDHVANYSFRINDATYSTVINKDDETVEQSVDSKLVETKRSTLIERINVFKRNKNMEYMTDS